MVIDSPTRSIPSRVTQRTVIAFNQAIARQIRNKELINLNLRAHCTGKLRKGGKMSTAVATVARGAIKNRSLDRDARRDVSLNPINIFASSTATLLSSPA